MMWVEAWPKGQGGRHPATYDEAMERSRFFLEAAKLLVKLGPEMIRAAGFRGTRRPDAAGDECVYDLPDAEELFLEDHVEMLAFGWGKRSRLGGDHA